MLTNVTLVDDNGTPGNSSDDLTVCAGITLEAGATTSYNRIATLTWTTTSVSTATGQDPLGNAVFASDTVTVTVQPTEEIPIGIYLPIVMRSSDYLP